MDPKGTLIVSDAHLGAAPPAHESAFRAFLATAADRTRDLVINGDLFDFWFEYRTVIQSRHFETLRVLRDLVESGVRVRLVAGNHDFWGDRFLSHEIGVELVEGPVRTVLGGRCTLLAHGDGLGGGDLGYRALKSVIRSRPARFGFRWLHPDFSAGLIRLVSRTESRHGRSPDDESLGRAASLRTWAAEQLAGDPSVDLVALAHCHVPEIREIDPGRYYLNSGDWVRHCSWAEVEPAGLRLCRLLDPASESSREILREVPFRDPVAAAETGSAQEVSEPQGPTGTL